MTSKIARVPFLWMLQQLRSADSNLWAVMQTNSLGKQRFKEKLGAIQWNREEDGRLGHLGCRVSPPHLWVKACSHKEAHGLAYVVLIEWPQITQFLLSWSMRASMRLRGYCSQALWGGRKAAWPHAPELDHWLDVPPPAADVSHLKCTTAMCWPTPGYNLLESCSNVCDSPRIAFCRRAKFSMPSFAHSFQWLRPPAGSMVGGWGPHFLKVGLPTWSLTPHTDPLPPLTQSTFNFSVVHKEISSILQEKKCALLDMYEIARVGVGKWCVFSSLDLLLPPFNTWNKCLLWTVMG